jgi:hypothetical protein
VLLVTGIGILKNELITKISPVLFNNSFRLGLPAFVVSPRCIEVTIKTAMQFSTAKCAYFPPANRKFDFYCLETETASFHQIHRNDLLSESEVCTTFLKSESHCHSRAG